MHRTKIASLLIGAIAATLAFGGPSHAETLTTLASFNGTNGASPGDSLTPSPDGSTLFGMTQYGGANGDGAIFSIPATGGTPTVLASFNGTDGANPYGDLTLVGSTLYGMTGSGGTNNAGAIFSIPATGGTPTVLLSFNGANGVSPTGSLTLSADGSTLYGMTEAGGSGYGNIFSIPVGGGAPTTLATFNGTSGGEYPAGSLTLSADGSTLYGMTGGGGTSGDGTIFSVPVTGGTPTTLASFNGADGANPTFNNLTNDLTLSGSTLFGMTYGGGASGDGVIFSLPLTGGTPSVLAAFDGTNGGLPWGSLTLSGSTLYGMSYEGGTSNAGTIFSIPVAGGGLTNLISFNYTNGAQPYGSLTLDGSAFYGMTQRGGTNNDGTVFALSPTPEPSSLLLAALGAAGVLATGMRRNLRRAASG